MAADNDDQDNGSPTDVDLPVKNHRRSAPSSGREDCWSEGATSALIDAWGERYVALDRGSLKQKHWEEVAEVVAAARIAGGKPPRTHVQCKYRIDTVKKKYKSEKAKQASTADQRASDWKFFDRVDQLLGNPNAKIPVSRQPDPTNLRQRKKPVPVDSGSDDEDIWPESSESLPPVNLEDRRGRKRERTEINSDSPRPVKSLKELTKAITRFGEVYERAEKAKLKQMVEIETQRMKFAKEIELQRMRFLVETQVELSQIGRGSGRVRGPVGAGGEDSNHRHHVKDETNVNNNSNSSN